MMMIMGWFRVGGLCSVLCFAERGGGCVSVKERQEGGTSKEFVEIANFSFPLNFLSTCNCELSSWQENLEVEGEMRSLQVRLRILKRGKQDLLMKSWDWRLCNLVFVQKF